MDPRTPNDCETCEGSGFVYDNSCGDVECCGASTGYWECSECNGEGKKSKENNND